MKTRQIALFAFTVLALTNQSCNKDDDLLEMNIPAANAGGDQQVEIGATALLDASGSVDPGGKDIAYQWEFIGKPETSAATIIGIGKEQAEFVLDKAGTYLVKLTVSNGTQQASDSVVITNKAPVLSSVDYDTDINSTGDYAQIGEEIYVFGNYFSKDINENEIHVNGISCPITDIQDLDNEMRINVIVPGEAVDGDLEVTVGPHSVKWPNPVAIIHFPVRKFIGTDNTLVERVRGEGRNDYKEVGTLFRPLVNGKVLGVGCRTPFNRSDVRISIWNVSDKLQITRYIMSSSSSSSRYRVLDEPVPVEAGREYLVTFVENAWYYYEHSPSDSLFPVETGKIEILGAVTSTTGMGYDEIPAVSVFPETPIDDYIVQGPDIVFAADVE